MSRTVPESSQSALEGDQQVTFNLYSIQSHTSHVVLSIKDFSAPNGVQRLSSDMGIIIHSHQYLEVLLKMSRQRLNTVWCVWCEGVRGAGGLT